MSLSDVMTFVCGLCLSLVAMAASLLPPPSSPLGQSSTLLTSPHSSLRCITQTQTISRRCGLLAYTPPTLRPKRNLDGSLTYYILLPSRVKGPLFVPEYEEHIDPDTIALPDGSSGSNLNTLEEFEMDYSQVGAGRRLEV